MDAKWLLDMRVSGTKRWISLAGKEGHFGVGALNYLKVNWELIDVMNEVTKSHR